VNVSAMKRSVFATYGIYESKDFDPGDGFYAGI
jgi:hypothetical protein